MESKRSEEVKRVDWREEEKKRRNERGKEWGKKRK